MEALIADFFNSFSRYILFLHVGSAIVLIGTLFAFRFIVKPVMYDIKIPRERYEKSIKMLRKFLIAATVLMVIILFSGFIMTIGLNFKNGNPATYVIVHTLNALWIFIMVNFIYVYFKYKEASKYIKKNDYILVHENLELIFTYIFPLNLLLGFVSMYFGILLRGY